MGVPQLYIDACVCVYHVMCELVFLAGDMETTTINKFWRIYIYICCKIESTIVIICNWAELLLYSQLIKLTFSS